MCSLTLPWALEPEETPSAPLLPAPLHLVLRPPPPAPLLLSTRVCVFTCPCHRRNHQLDRPHPSARGPVYTHPPGPRSSFGLSSGPRPLPPPEIKRLLSACLCRYPRNASPLAMMPTGPLALPSTAKLPESTVAASHRSLFTPNMLSLRPRTYSHVSILKVTPGDIWLGCVSLSSRILPPFCLLPLLSPELSSSQGS